MLKQCKHYFIVLKMKCVIIIMFKNFYVYVCEVLFNKRELDNQSCYLFQAKITGKSHSAVASLYCMFNVMLFFYDFKLLFCFVLFTPH